MSTTAQHRLSEQSISQLTIDNPRYSKQLRAIADPPKVLFAIGNLDLLNTPAVAIVGTRRMSRYGKRVVEELVPQLCRAGLTIVSGLAIGIDAEAARQTLDVEGSTIAVLGNGLPSIFPPSNIALAEEILKHDGLLLSEYPKGHPPSKYTFPARNRIIAGLSLGTIVVEAALKSGSLITARFALEEGRDIFAIPGQIFDKNLAGTHELIAKSEAKLITSATDVLMELGYTALPQERSQLHADSKEEETLLKALHPMPQSIDTLAELTKLPIASLNSTLTLMEIKGSAKHIGSNQWIRGG